MPPLRSLGHFLLWCGFLVGVFVTVRNAEVSTNKWSTIEWPIYVAALLVGVAGVVLLRMTQKAAATHADKMESDIRVLDVSVQNLLAEIGKLLARRQQIDVYSVHGLIDARFIESIDNFVESRETLIYKFGLPEYAEVMTDFSIAERNINRAWSASADGYIDEVWACLERADQRLTMVARNLEKYQKGRMRFNADDRGLET